MEVFNVAPDRARIHRNSGLRHEIDLIFLPQENLAIRSGTLPNPDCSASVYNEKRSIVMQSNKTHDQQMRIIQKHVNTANSDPDFDIEADLKRSGAAKKAFQKGDGLKPGPDSLTKDRGMLRGENQESAHHKGSGKPH
jgi:hypothetical protein